MTLVAVRLVLVAVTWAFTALLLGVWGTHRPWAVATTFAAAYLIPINLACFWLLARALAREGSSWKVLLGADRARLPSDLAAGGLLTLLLYFPFVVALGVGLLLTGVGPDLPSAMERAFAPPATLPSLSVPVAWGLALFVAIGFPLTNAPLEEMLYRGYAQRGLEEAGWPGWAVVLIPAMLFGLQHVAFAPTLGGALAYGLAFSAWGGAAGLFLRRRRRLFPLVIAHLITNGAFAWIPLWILARSAG